MLFGSSFERIISWHRFLAQWVLILVSVVHGVGFIIKWAFQHNLYDKVIVNERNFWGTVSLVVSLTMFFFSREHMRRTYYNYFRASHILLAPLYVYGVLQHHDGMELWRVLALPAVLIAVDVCYRIRNVLRHMEAHIVSLRRIGSNYVDIGIECQPKNMTFEPGQWAYIAIPHISATAMEPPKPFTLLLPMRDLLHSDNATFHVIVKQSGNKGRWSERLVETVREAKHTLLGAKVIVDGPYGQLSLPHPLLSYDSVLLIAGGIGCTPMVSLLDYYTATVDEGFGSEDAMSAEEGKLVGDSTSSSSLSSSHWHFAWSLRDAALFDDVTIKQRLSRSSATKSIYFTGAANVATKAEPEESNDDRMVRDGRPDLRREMLGAVRRSGSQGDRSVAVLVCGPSSMISDARDACYAIQEEEKSSGVRLDFHSETFEL